MRNLTPDEQGPSINQSNTECSKLLACHSQTWRWTVGSFLWPSLFFKAVYYVGITLFGLRKFLELMGADDLTSDIVSAALTVPACIVAALARHDKVKHQSEEVVEWILARAGYTPPKKYLDAKRKSCTDKYEINWDKYPAWGFQKIVLASICLLLLLTAAVAMFSNGLFAYLGGLTLINEPYQWISRSKHVPSSIELFAKCFALLSVIYNTFNFLAFGARKEMRGGLAIAAYLLDSNIRSNSSGLAFWGTALASILLTAANFMNGYFYSVHSLPLLIGASLTVSQIRLFAVLLRIFGVIFKLSSRVFSIFEFFDSGVQSTQQLEDKKSILGLKTEGKQSQKSFLANYIPIPNTTSCAGLSFYGLICSFAALDVLETTIGNFVSTNKVFTDFGVNIFSWPLYALVLMIIAIVVFINIFEGASQYTYVDIDMLKTVTRWLEKKPKYEVNVPLKDFGQSSAQNHIEAPKETDSLLVKNKSDENNGYSFWSWCTKQKPSVRDREPNSILPACNCCFN